MRKHAGLFLLCEEKITAEDAEGAEGLKTAEDAEDAEEKRQETKRKAQKAKAKRQKAKQEQKQRPEQEQGQKQVTENQAPAGENARGRFFFMEDDMAEFEALRAERKRVLEIEGAPERVFPLLCPVREAEWVPGWEYRMVFSRSGVAELGCVFTTPGDQGGEIVWVISEYDPERRIGFVWVRPGLVSARLRFDVSAEGTKTKIVSAYEYTGLSEAGNQEVRRYSEEWFGEKMGSFAAALTHYLRTGKMISAEAWG